MFAAIGTTAVALGLDGVRGVVVVAVGAVGGLSLRGFGTPGMPLPAAYSGSPRPFFLTGCMVAGRSAGEKGGAGKRGERGERRQRGERGKGEVDVKAPQRNHSGRQIEEKYGDASLPPARPRLPQPFAKKRSFNLAGIAPMETQTAACPLATHRDNPKTQGVRLPPPNQQR